MGVLQPYKIKPRYIPKNTKHEESLQLQVCSYLRLQYPDVIFRSDYASGLHLTIAQATKHKRLQSSRGWPDLVIYKRMEHKGVVYSGLALELKKEGSSVIMKIGPRKGHLSTNSHIQEQAVILKALIKEGFYANFAIGIDDAIKQIDWYMRKPQNGQLF